MLWPKVVGQSGTASAAPVFVTSPPNKISTSVAAAVATARRCASRLMPATCSPRTTIPAARRSVPGGRDAAGRLRLREEVLLRFRRAVLVGPAVHGGQRGSPVQVRRRRRR